MLSSLFTATQYVLPQQGVTRLAGGLAESKKAWIKNPLIRSFIKAYKVNMQEALYERPEDYSNFNGFFTRQLKPGARPIAEQENGIVSPADGVISQIGDIHENQLIQAKGIQYDMVKLLGGDADRALPFTGGKFATIYLSPKDYHRVHMPFTGELQEMVYVPGRLFSVNDATAQRVKGLFTRNERMIALYSTAFGPMAVIMVGAMIVGGIVTTWAGQVQGKQRRVKNINYYHDSEQPVRLAKGQELGFFQLGSTVILLFPKDGINWSTRMQVSTSVKMGQLLATVC